MHNSPKDTQNDYRDTKLLQKDTNLQKTTKLIAAVMQMTTKIHKTTTETLNDHETHDLKQNRDLNMLRTSASLS